MSNKAGPYSATEHDPKRSLADQSRARKLPKGRFGKERLRKIVAEWEMISLQAR